MAKLRAKFFEVSDGTEHHTIYKFSERQPDALWETFRSSDIFNLVMMDASCSMIPYWDTIVAHWNKLIVPALKGQTSIFVFGNDVQLKRNEAFLETSDILRQTTNLTKAIEVIGSNIQGSSQQFIRLFLATDGHHNANNLSPSDVISKLSVPKGKTVEVYLLGIGAYFPAEFSILIRSALHNGNSNIPSIFWACNSDSSLNKNEIIEGIKTQISNIAYFISKRGYMELRISSGFLAPGLPCTNIAHIGEYIYFPIPSSEVRSTLSVLNEDDVLDIDLEESQVDLEYFLDKVFCQWNSLLIQYHRRKLKIPLEAFVVMERIYTILMTNFELEVKNECSNESVKSRILKKKIKTLNTKFRTQINRSKLVIGIEGKYESEIELAKDILKSTVKSENGLKNLKLRGYGMEQYLEDVEFFLDVYQKTRVHILSLPEPPLEDCCRITCGSFVKDLQDPSFSSLLQEDKFTFMKLVSIAGFPICAPLKNFSQINPWTLNIKHILKSPYRIISQNVLQIWPEDKKHANSVIDEKNVQFDKFDKTTKFNAVVPVFQEDIAIVLKPLIRTNIFAMLSTFCIFRNPHIVDYNAHLAALACCWVKSISEYPKNKRPEFVTNQISLLKATGNIYMDRDDVISYLTALVNKPSTTLMTECLISNERRPIKSESFTKPTFLLYLRSEKSETSSIVCDILPLMMKEFIGRCLTTRNRKYIYEAMFVPELRTKKKREIFFTKKLSDTCDELFSLFIQEKGKLLRTYYFAERLFKELRQFCHERIGRTLESMYEIRINMKIIKNLKSVTRAGNIQFRGFKAFAAEMDLSQESIDEIFNKEKMLVYALHGLQNKTSRDRMEKPLPTYEEALKQINKELSAECGKIFKDALCRKILEKAQSVWTEEFMSVHSPVLVQPMTRTRIISSAHRQKIEVEEETFDSVYEYDETCGLLRNACMVETCPFFLVPRKDFNQHISAERQNGFPHRIHKVALEVATVGGGVNTVIRKLKGGKQRRRKNEQRILWSSLESIRKEISVLVEQYKHFI